MMAVEKLSFVNGSRVANRENLHEFLRRILVGGEINTEWIRAVVVGSYKVDWAESRVLHELRGCRNAISERVTAGRIVGFTVKQT